MSLVPAVLLATFATVALGTGCSPLPPEKTKGQAGVAEFSLSAAQCLLGCPTDHPVLLGSAITVQATMTTRTEDAFVLHLPDAATGTIENATQTCSCDSDNGSASIECSATCPAGQTKSLMVSADVQTKTAGIVALDLRDAHGLTVDSTSIVVRPAMTLTATVKSAPKAVDGVPVSPGADGAYTVHVGNEVDVSFDAADDQGNDLAFSRHGVIPTYSNAKALTPTKEIGALIFGFTNTEVADAVGAGNGQISLAAQGASTTVKFHVVK